MGRDRAAADVVRLAAAGAGLADGRLPRASPRRSLCWCSSSSRAPRSTATRTGSSSAVRSGSSPPSWPSSRWCSGAPTCWPASSGCSASGSTCWCRCVPVGGLILGLVLLGGDLGTAIILAAILGGAAVGRRRADPAARRWRRPGRAGRRVDGQHPVDPAVAHHRLAAPRPGRPAGQRLAGAARQVRARVRRLVGRRPRRLQGEVGQPARGAHRLHLRDHRRGARPGRHPRGAGAVRRRSATPACGSRSTPPTRSSGWPPPASRPGSSCRRWSTSAPCSAPADHRRPAAAGLVRRLGAVPTMLGLGMLLSFARVAHDRPASRSAAAAAAAPARTTGWRGSRARRPRRGRLRRPHRACAGLRRRAAPPRPDGRGHRAGHRARAGHPAHPGARLRPRAHPAGADPAPPGPGPARASRRGCGARSRQPPRCCATGAADVLVGFGGFVSGPAYLAARRLQVPIVVHEANPRPGWANRLGARFTPYVATTFPGTPIAHGRHVGLPIRRSIATLDRAATRAEARAHFGLDADRPTLLVTGGSQGARRLNDAASGAAAAPARGRRPGAARHRHGAHGDVSRRGGRRRTSCVPYLDRMELAYAAADLALCRAGANTVVELTAVGLPAAYVPLPIGNGEQELIARPVVEAGGGLLVDDAALHAGWVRDDADPAAHRPRPVGHAWVGRPPAAAGRDADERLVDLVLEAAASAAGARRRDGGEHGRRHGRRAPVPAEELGRVHFIGIGGAGMSGIARIMLARGLPVSRQRRQGLGALSRPARPRRDRPRRARRRPRRRARHRRRLHRDPREQPRAGRGPPPRACASCTGPARWPR